MFLAGRKKITWCQNELILFPTGYLDFEVEDTAPQAKCAHREKSGIEYMYLIPEFLSKEGNPMECWELENNIWETFRNISNL